MHEPLTYRDGRPTEESLPAAVGIGGDRTFGPNYRITDGRAHHVNDAPGEAGLPAVWVDGVWRLAGSGDNDA
jgi:hypothetical protein